MKKVLLIDNYDSFTYNLVHQLEELLSEPITVLKNDELQPSLVAQHSHLIISPGPGLPTEAGKLMPTLKSCMGKQKVLGVCLGLQAIAELYGTELRQLPRPQHGIKSRINRQEKSSRLYLGMPESFLVGRYHSWVIDELSLPASLQITALDETGVIMSIEDSTNDVYAVQYHPESYMTEYGKEILNNFLSL